MCDVHAFLIYGVASVRALHLVEIVSAFLKSIPKHVTIPIDEMFKMVTFTTSNDLEFNLKQSRTVLNAWSVHELCS